MYIEVIGVKGKKGEKELQMIFGLFILLIITLVVLNLFLQTAKKGSSTVAQNQAAELAEQALKRMTLNCEALCQSIVDENTAIEYCAKFETLETDNTKNSIAQKARRGKFEFCTSKVPCFLITENCQNGIYTAQTCKALLRQNRATWDLYTKIIRDVGTNPTNAATGSDGCGLAITSPNNFSNWKLVYGYTDPLPMGPGGP